jgi:hypothetical protein
MTGRELITGLFHTRLTRLAFATGLFLLLAALGLGLTRKVPLGHLPLVSYLILVFAFQIMGTPLFFGFGPVGLRRIASFFVAIPLVLIAASWLLGL